MKSATLLSMLTAIDSHLRPSPPSPRKLPAHCRHKQETLKFDDSSLAQHNVQYYSNPVNSDCSQCRPRQMNALSAHSKPPPPFLCASASTRHGAIPSPERAAIYHCTR